MLMTMKELRGFGIEATDGEVGHIEELYFDQDTWDVRYIVVAVGNWFNRQHVLLVPSTFLSIDRESETAAASLTREQVKASPNIDLHKPISRAIEASLHDHYEWQPYWLANSLGTLSAEPHLSAATPPTPIITSENQEEVEKRAGLHEESHSNLRSTKEVTGYAIAATDGNLGHVDTFYIDVENWKIRYVIVDTRDWLPGKKVIVSPMWVSAIDWNESTMSLSLAQEAIKESPEYEPNAPLKRGYEERLFEYYDRMPYW